MSNLTVMKNWTFPLLALPALLSLSTSLLAQTIRQEAYLKASNTDPDDQFGWSLALDGATLLVAAPDEASSALTINGDQSDNSYPNRGAAYVFVRGDDGGWTQQAYLKGPVATKEFGHSCALQGDTAILSYGVYSGPQGASVFARNDSGDWSIQGNLRASNQDPADDFGRAIAIDRDTVVIGARLEDSASREINGDQGNAPRNNNGDHNSGAAYVFVRNESGQWAQQAYLKASDGQTGDNFGWKVAIDMNTAVVGSYEFRREPRYAGAAYVFERDDSGTWSEQAILKATYRDEGDRFSRALDIDGDTIVIGAYWDDGAARGINGDESDNSVRDTGAVHVFVRDSTGQWRKQAYIKSDEPSAGEYFGSSVDLQGDYLVVGAYGEDGEVTDSGAAYLFTRDKSGTWHQKARFRASNPGEGDFYALNGVAIDGGLICVSASNEDSAATGINGDQDDDSAEDAGAVYVFSLQPSSGVFSVERRSDGEIEIDFGGTLQRSADLRNWFDLDPQPLSPWRFMPSEEVEYFRARRDQ